VKPVTSSLPLKRIEPSCTPSTLRVTSTITFDCGEGGNV
jgi:hypothetical protein